MAVELTDGISSEYVCRKLFEDGIITDNFLFDDRSFRIAPPLIITEDEITTVCDTILRVLDGI
jgi:4-aminobutyrate aminotransferase-like enzyme